MKKVAWLVTVILMACISLASNASDLQNYVGQCQSELGFNASDVPAMNCTTDGYQFAFGKDAQNAPNGVNDFVGYKRINAAVDLLFACRWVDATPSVNGAASIELLIHNRQNGSTCFFAAQETNKSTPVHPVPISIVSPTNFNPVHDPKTNPNADDFWLQPFAVENKMLPFNMDDSTSFKDAPDSISTMGQSARCVGCHVQGPYIASADIAPFLAKFGLLNDGHDTIADMTVTNHYHAVGSSAFNNASDPANLSPFRAWDSFIFGNIAEDKNNKPLQDCNSNCHSLGTQSMIGTLFFVNPVLAVRLLPSLKSDINYFKKLGNGMPPLDDTTLGNNGSPYRWINRDNPGISGMDLETFTASKARFPVTQSDCGVPAFLEARMVNSPATDADATFYTTQLSALPDKLKTFNTRDGLTCLNTDQPAGKKCSDYSVRYLCSNGTWTQFFNNDQNANDDGDHEERTGNFNSLLLYACGGAPVGIQLRVLESWGMAQITGPNDKLMQFAPSGLICRNSDQSNGGQCSNYEVRYRGCRASTDAILVKIKNSWVNPPTFNDRYLTTTNNASGSETRAQANNYQYPSQDWIIENVSGGGTVRLKDVWSGKYLTASSNGNLSAVVVQDSDSSLMRQQWYEEVINNNGPEVRFRNVSSGLYLTVGNYTGTDPYYAPIISQSLSNQNWASQRWIIQ